MPGAAAVATHPRAGRVEPVRIAARIGPDRETLGTNAAAPVTAEAALAPGTRRLGPLEVTLELRSGSAEAALALRLRNASGRDLAAESVILGFRWSAHGARSLRFLRNGWQSWSDTGARELDDAGEPAFPSGSWLRGLHHAVGTLPGDRDGWHESHGVTVVGASPDGPVCLAGVAERGESFGVVYLRRDGDAVRIEVELRLDALLAPGESRGLEEVRVALGVDASELLEAHAEDWGRSAGARVAHPFVSGWCSWYHLFHRVGEADVLRNLEALHAARDSLPIDVVQIDDGYQRCVGDWLETNERFPRGLAPLAAAIRAAGFRAGIWTAPFCAVRESRWFAEHEEWLLRRDGAPFRGLVHPVWSADASVYVLDTSREEVLAELRDVARALVEMGFGYLKLDFLYAAALRASAHDPRVSRAARLRRGLEAIREGAGEETFLLGCGCPLGPAVGLVDGMRIGPDVAPRWRTAPDLAIAGIEESLPATRSAVRSALARVWMHRRLWLNDPDCLMARSDDTELGEAERRTLAAAIGLTGGMGIFSDDLPSLAEGDRALLRETLAIAREVDTLGLPGRARALEPLAAPIVGALAASTPDADRVVLVNGEDEARERRVDLAALGPRPTAAEPELLLGAPKAQVDASGRLAVELAPHASALYRVPREVPLAVFCDFDGTFAVQDVGATLAQRYAGERRPRVWDRYVRGEIRAWDYNLEVLDGLPVPLRDLESFLESIELDPGAAELVRWCEERDVPFRVLSDGFDWNLNRLQALHGVRFAYDANHMHYEGGRWRIRAGHPNPGCGCGTGSCKRGRIEAFRGRSPGARVVHIGNGRVSDLCGALAADHAFAKDSLATELERRGEPFERFTTLRDVISRLKTLLEGD